MFRHYLHTMIRNFKRFPLYSSINIIGFAVGMASALLIFLWVSDEMSYDSYHKDADRIYRVGSQWGPTEKDKNPYTSPPMAAALRDELPEIEEAARLNLWQRDIVVKHNDREFIEKRIISADNEMFEIFSIPFITGDLNTALDKPDTIVVSESTAKKYFGVGVNPIGKVLRFKQLKRDFIITGMIEDCPTNSHIQYDIIASILSSPTSRSQSWMRHCYFTYVKLQANVNVSSLSTKFIDLIDKHYGPAFLKRKGIPFREYISNKDTYYNYWLQPLSDIHLNTAIVDNIPNKGDWGSIIIFSAVALLIILLGCVNFINLTTARASVRLNEVGVRKVFGSSRKELIRHFFSESFMTILVSMIIAIAIVLLALPAFNSFSGTSFSPSTFLQINVISGIIGIVIVVSMLAGIFPALYLSKFKPVSLLSKQSSSDKKGRNVRRLLVVFQFTISIIIIICTIFVYKQLAFLQQKDLGFEKNNIVAIRRPYSLGNRGAAFKETLLKNSNVQTVSYSSTLPGESCEWTSSFRYETTPVTEEYHLNYIRADHAYKELLGFKISKGRFFSDDENRDKNSILINKATARLLGITDPIGKRFIRKAKKDEYYTIIGLLDDLNFQSLHNKIEPQIVTYNPNEMEFYLSIKINDNNKQATLGYIENKWREFTGGLPLIYSFLEDDLENLYRTEAKISNLLGIFTFLAIVIANLGLLGLVIFTTETKRKEISIRKVIGARNRDILTLISHDLLRWITIANLISWPLSFFMVGNWLDTFSYRTGLSVLPFILAGLGVLVIALLTTGFLTLKAIKENPIKSLRYE